jgi:hypothetical protein
LAVIVARQGAILFMAVASPAMLVSFFVAGFWGELVFTVLVAGFPVALIVMGVNGRRSLGPLRLPLVCLLLILEGCAVTLLLLKGQGIDGPWIGGLPLAAAVQLYGLWLLPLPLVTLTYALTFDRYELRDGDLQRLEALRASTDFSTGAS